MLMRTVFVAFITIGKRVCMGDQRSTGQNMHMGINSLVYQHDTYNKDHQASTELFKPLSFSAIHRLQNNSISVKKGYLYPGIYPGIAIYTYSNL